MTGSPHQRLRSVFDAAQELPPAERAAFVACACGEAVQLRDRILQLLAAGEHTRFLVSPEQAAGGTALPTTGEGVGSTIGPYALVRELGEGGFGVVFLAEQTQPVARQVALKVLKPGMDSRQIVARFEHERQALARMEHPHIARVIDAGTTAAGRPFFVMEFVDGLPLVEHCDRHHLPLRERLELFVQVCDAVQHAHGRGVLHRDLKPSNMLVAMQDGRPFAKVIDFGIAKAITDRGPEAPMLTEASQVVGTLLYMSPEQAEGAQDLDVRTDVFSLGAVLYELLAGNSPFDVATTEVAWRAELQRRIREVDPLPPSRRLTSSGERLTTLARHRHTTAQRLCAQVRGELDWIVMKALEKDRGRRYPTAHAFAEDLRRHLAGVALLVSLTGGASAFAWQADVARTERDHADTARTAEATQRKLADERATAAQQARDEAEAMTRFVTDALETANPYHGGRESMSVREAMTQAIARLDAGALRAMPHAEVHLRARIAAILYGNDGSREAIDVARRAVDLGRGLGSADAHELTVALAIQALATARVGDPVAAEPLIEEAIARCQQPATRDDALALQTLGALARIRVERGRPREALAPAEAAHAMAEQLFPDDAFERAETLGLLANVQQELGRFAAAEQFAEQALAMHRRLHDGDHPSIAFTLTALANARLKLGKLPLAIADYEALLPMLRRLFRDGDQVAVALHNLAVAYWSTKQAARAEPLFLEALELHRKALPSPHPAIARNLKNLGSAWRVLGKKEDAERVLLESVAMWEELFPDGHPERADAILGLAVLHREQGKLDDALREAEAAAAMRQATLGPAHPELARTWYVLGEIHMQRNAPAAAVPAYREALATFRRTIHGDHPELVATQIRLADALLGSADPAGAAPLYEESLAMQSRLGGGDANLALGWSGLARARQESGDAAGARAAFDEAIERFARIAPNGSPPRARTLWRSGQARLAGGDAKAALPELEAALAMSTKVLPANHPHLEDCRASLAACQAALARCGGGAQRPSATNAPHSPGSNAPACRSSAMRASCTLRSAAAGASPSSHSAR